MLPIGTLRNITFLGLDIDRDVGGPPMETFWSGNNEKNMEFFEEIFLKT